MNQKNHIPGWINFAAIIFVVLGVLVGIYNFIFLKEKTDLKYKKEVNLYIVSSKMDMIVPQRTQEAINSGKNLFAQVCAACHGADLKGGVGPNLLDNEWRNPPGKETNLFKLVWNGIPNGNPPMPAKGGRTDLTSEQVWQILYYISSLNPNIQKDAVPNQ